MELRENLLRTAKERLDYIIQIARVDMYKPIQIAEVLYHSRIDMAQINTDDLETYRNPSVHWRDEVTQELTGKRSTSSARYQHDVWNESAMPSRLLSVLDEENKRTKGAVEKYIYTKFEQRQDTVASVITLIEEAIPETLKIADIFALFTQIKTLRRSIDKVYEVVVYSLLETVVTALEATVTVTISKTKTGLFNDFADLAKVLLGITSETLYATASAHIYRVGVTNAADRGLDMWANFGPAIQVKHLTLDPKLAEAIVDQVESDNIIIMCREADRTVIDVLVRQIGWGRRVRAIITESELIDWYERCLRGQNANILANSLLERLQTEFKREFPQSAKIVDFMERRNYTKIELTEFWRV